MYHDESLFLRQCNLILAHSKPSLVFSRQLQCSHAPTQSTQRSYYLPQRIHISRRCEKVSQLLDDTRYIFALKSTFQNRVKKTALQTTLLRVQFAKWPTQPQQHVLWIPNTRRQTRSPSTFKKNTHLLWALAHADAMDAASFRLGFLGRGRKRNPERQILSRSIYCRIPAEWVGPNLATDFSQADVVLVCLCQDVPSQSEKLEMVGPSMKKFNSTDGALK